MRRAAECPLLLRRGQPDPWVNALVSGERGNADRVAAERRSRGTKMLLERERSSVFSRSHDGSHTAYRRFRPTMLKFPWKSPTNR